MPRFWDKNDDGLREPQDEPYLLFTKPTYDTWPLDYEHDGVDQDGVAPWYQNSAYDWRRRVDQGFNGLDDNDARGVDDYSERETRPPYDTKLRGVRVKIRIIDPDTRQVQQTTVAADFTN